MTQFEELLSHVPQGLLFHYTSQEGLSGILSTRLLWASKIHYLNDSAEFSYFLDLMSARLDVLYRNGKINEIFKKEASSYSGGIRRINIFVASFSENGDLLSQWRAYCPPTGGYSVGFSHQTIKPFLDEQSFTLLKCIYDVDLQVNIMDQLLQEFFARDIASGDKSSPYLFDLLTAACSFKHPAFTEEKEWRAVSHVTSYSSASFRPSKSFIIPYYSLRLGPPEGEFIVDKIIVGPTPHTRLSVESVRGLVVKTLGHKLTDIVSHSSRPYRNW